MRVPVRDLGRSRLIMSDGELRPYNPAAVARALDDRGIPTTAAARIVDTMSRWVDRLGTDVPAYLFDAALESNIKALAESVDDSPGPKPNGNARGETAGGTETGTTTGEKPKPPERKPGGGLGDGPQPSDAPGPVHIYGHHIEITRPLVFVPGILGSKLYRKRVGHAREQIFPPSPMVDDGWKSSFQRLSMKDHFVPAGPGEPMGLTDGAYDELVAFLTGDLGFKLNENFWIFAYNWMESNKDSGQLLAVFINDYILAHHPGWPSVDVISHSMGGIVLRAAIKIGDTRGQPAKVGRSMYLASPHYGAPKSYFFLKPDVPILGGMASSFLAEAAWKHARDQGEPGLEEGVKRLARSCRSVYELLPDEYYFDEKKTIVKVNTAFYSNDYDVSGLAATYYTDPNSKFDENQIPIVREAMDFKAQLGKQLPGDYRVLYNQDVQPTNDLVWYIIRTAINPYSTGFGQPFDSGQHGDGTVPTVSGQGPGGTVIPGPGITHCALPNVEPTFEQIVDYLFPNPKGK